MSAVQLRLGHQDDIPSIIDVHLLAFGTSGAFFPDAATREADTRAWLTTNISATFSDPGRFYVIAVASGPDGTESIAGFAEWVAPGGADPDTPSEIRKAKAELRRKNWPAGFDRAAMTEYGQTLGPALKASLEKLGLPPGQDGQMWDLNSLAVHPNHQRKGIGRRLTQWGIDRAASDGKDVLIVARTEGAPLYRSMGLEMFGEAKVFDGEYQERKEFYILRHGSRG
ncbi:acyl-CoA N-acyltransferase [Thozetella sp. PMI_491]|nr:acyl-CoA N-acyltransferase [Thozetella sp. PMI_491]